MVPVLLPMGHPPTCTKAGCPGALTTVQVRDLMSELYGLLLAGNRVTCMTCQGTRHKHISIIVLIAA
jgi:hypothetical protein